MKVSRWGGRLGLCCLLTLAFLWSCRDEPPSNFDSNLAPETIITGAPAESTLWYYQVHMYWHGTDPDGLVDHYEYSVTDSNKTPGEDDIGFSGYYKTVRTDSTFLLKADRPQILGHRFYVRSVDNEGKTDPTPAWTYFIAEDFNFPRVEFISATASWTGRDGSHTNVPITSSKVAAPTDTVGVGATLSVTWTGDDDDLNGHVVGYEWRHIDDFEYTPTTVDTSTVTRSFALPAGSALSLYKTGNYALYVRAIDDAGAKTTPDSVRSVIVNFGPNAFIVDPDTLSEFRRKFVEDRGRTYPSGTTLADGIRFIRFKYTGYDDPRDMSLDPANPSGIIGFQQRRLKSGGGLAYEDVVGWNSYPTVSDFDDGKPLTSGDYVYLIRAQDELGRHGRPDTLRVSVNYAPYLTFVQYEDPADGLMKDLWVPGPGASSGDTVSVSIPQNTGGGYDDLHVVFEGRDDHFLSPNTHPLDFNRVVEEELANVHSYAARLNNARTGFDDAPVDTAGIPIPAERYFPVDPEGGSGVVSDGLNVIEFRVRDFSGRISVRFVYFDATLEP